MLLFAPPVPFRKGAFHDIPSATHDRGYAGAQSLAAYPNLLRATGLAVCTPLQPVTASPGPCSILIAVAALRFLYKVTLHRDWTLQDIIPTPQKPQKLPIVLSREEVLQFLGCVQSLKHRRGSRIKLIGRWHDFA